MKLTKKAALELVHNLYKDKETLKSSVAFDMEIPITVERYDEAGERVCNCFCRKCGHKFEKRLKTDYWRSADVDHCPNCGNDLVQYNSHKSGRGSYVHIDMCEEGFLFRIFFVNVSGTGSNWFENDLTYSVTMNYAGMYHNRFGYLIVSNSMENFMTRANCYYSSAIGKLKKAIPVNMEKEEFVHLLENANKNEKEREIKKASRQPVKRTVVHDIRKDETDPAKQQEVEDKVNVVIRKLYSNRNHQNIYAYMCTNCKHIEYGKSDMLETNEDENDCIVYTCPKCGKKYIEDEILTEDSPYWGYRSRYLLREEGHHTKRLTIENTNDDSNGLLYRAWEFYYDFDVSNGQMEKRSIEAARIYISKKNGVSYYINKDGTWTKCVSNSVQLRNSLDYSAPHLQTNEEIAEIIRNSEFKYSGLIEAYGVGDPRYSSYGNFFSLTYPSAWIKEPRIEKILKAKLTNLLSSVIRGSLILKDGENLHEMFGVSQKVMKMIIKRNCNLDEFQNIVMLANADPNFNEEIYEQIIAMEKVNIQTVAELKKRFDISYEKTITFMENVYNNQCIEKDDAIQIWLDYLTMAKEMHVDMSEKNRVYPTSLKKEHDVTSFAHKAMAQRISKEKFEAQAIKNAEEYEFKDKDYLVIVPRTPEEVIEEATRQHNCLKSYINRLAEGDTVVAFVRRAENPTEAFLTAEIKNGVLNQLKAKYNHEPKDKKAIEFVHVWAAKKGFVA